MNTEKLVKVAKAKLGNQAFIENITDEMYIDLLSEAHNQFSLFSNISKEFDENELDRLIKPWTSQYFFALVKECAGNIISSSYTNFNNNDFDYLYLLKEAEAEKVALIKVLYPKYKYENREDIVLVAVYINVGNLEEKEVDLVANKVRDRLSGSLPNFIKSIIIPIRKGEPRIELVFSNDKSMNTARVQDLYNEFKDLDSEIEKYLTESHEE
jgi:hypothetical protein